MIHDYWIHDYYLHEFLAFCFVMAVGLFVPTTILILGFFLDDDSFRKGRGK